MNEHYEDTDEMDDGDAKRFLAARLKEMLQQRKAAREAKASGAMGATERSCECCTAAIRDAQGSCGETDLGHSDMKRG